MNVFELAGTFAIKGVDAAKSQIKTVTAEAKTGFGETEAASDKASGKLSGTLSKVGGAMGTVAKVGIGALAAGATAATAAIGGIAKSSLDAYASYEQLTGGVETLFGASAGTVEQYADNAYKTAGMSANAYMETVTGFSASLLQSLGNDTAAAAEKGNMAVTDMSDNANKMGTSIGSIQDAYQGFAKQNYTMLDNLKLGYGGTQEEMQRLLSDAEAISGVHYDISSYADVVDAIHVVQTEMGITGTTAKEASTTIEGSVNSAKASWTNWLTDLGRDDADMSQSTSELVESIVTAANNIIPRLVQIMTSIASTLATQIPAMVSQLGTVMQENGPPLLEAAKSLFLAIVQALVTVVPQILAALVEAVIQMVPQLLSMIPTLLAAGIQLFISLIQALTTVLPSLIEQLPMLVNQVGTVLVENIPLLLDAAVQLFGALLTALVQNAPGILSSLINLIGSLVLAVVSKVGDMLAGGVEFLGGFVSGLGSVDVLGAIGGIIDSIIGAFGDAGSWLVDAGASILQGLWDGISGGLDWLGDQLAGIGDFIVQHKGPPAADAVLLEDNGSLILTSLVNGILGGVPALRRALGEVTDEVSANINPKVAAMSYPTGLSAQARTRSDGVTGAGTPRQARKDDLLSALSEMLALLRAILDKDTDVYLDGDVLVGKTSKRMERSISKRDKLSGGIA